MRYYQNYCYQVIENIMITFLQEEVVQEYQTWRPVLEVLHRDVCHQLVVYRAVGLKDILSLY